MKNKNIVKFLSQLRQLNIQVWAEGSKLRCKAPEGVLTPQLQQEIASRKAEILSFLQQVKQDIFTSPTAIKVIPRNQHLPLSFAQERLWFLNQLEESKAPYIEQGALRMTGKFNIQAFQQALAKIVQRHEVFRTHFHCYNGSPVQVIDPKVTFEIDVLDWQHLEADKQKAQVQQFAQQQAETPFDLSKSPLFRATLLQIQPFEFIFLLTIHHIVSDGWSIAIFVQELFALYQSYTQNKPSPLPELSVQYADFALWQRQWFTGEIQQKQLQYWKQQLAGAPDLLQLPCDYPRLAVQTYRGKTQRFVLDKQLTQQLQKISEDSGSTLFMTLLAAFAVLLFRYSGQEDIIIGSPIANRNRPEIEPLIGFFANTLVLRSRLQGNPSFAELLNQVRDVTLEAYEHQDIPFEQVVEALQPERSLSFSPLFQVMLVLQNSPMQSWELPDVTLMPLLEIEPETAKFDLLLSMEENKTGLVGSWEYSTDLFEAQTIAQMAGHFQALLTAIVANPQQNIEQLPLLNPLERQQLLSPENHFLTEIGVNQCIHQLFEEQVKRTPDAIAVVFEEQQLTYQLLNERANQLAHYLQHLEIGLDGQVGLWIKPSIEMIVGVLGILKAGAAYVPIEPSEPVDRVADLLQRVKIPILLTQQKYQDRCSQLKILVISLDSEWSTISQQNRQNPEVVITPEKTAYIINLDGQSFWVNHQAVSSRLQWLQSQVSLSPGETVLQQASLTQDSAVRELLPLVVGGCVVILPPEKLDNPTAWQQLMTQQKISMVNFLPSQLSAFWANLSQENARKFYHLRWIFCSGEPLYKSDVEVCYQLLNCSFFYFYYLPEIAAEVSFWRCQSAQKTEVVPAGFPTYFSVYILDHHGEPVPPIVKGEIYIGGFHLPKNSPLQETQYLPAIGFVEHPQLGLLFKTGEWGRRRIKSSLELLGFQQRFAWIKGYRVNLQIIEQVLLTIAGVKDCYVILRQRDLVAYVVASESFSLPLLHSQLRSQLPSYMIPSALVPISNLPLTAEGEVDEQALTRLPVIDSELVERWEKHWRSLSDIEIVAVVVEEHQSRLTSPLRLHLSDLLAVDQITDHFFFPQVETASNRENITSVNLKSTVPAISHGGQLTIPETAPKTLIEALLQTATQHQEKGIIYILSNEEEVSQTYGSLLEEAQCILNGLRHQGLKAGDRIILQIESLRDYFPALWGCILGGIQPVTVTVAATYQEKNAVVKKLCDTWELLDSPPILASQSLLEPLQNLRKLFSLCQWQVILLEQMRDYSPTAQFNHSNPDDVAFLQLTSGSTGIPKLIQETHQGIIAHIHAVQQFNGYHSENICLNWLPFDHVVPLLTCHFKDTYLGCQQIEVATPVILGNPLKWLDFIEKYQVSHTWSPNFGFQLLIDDLNKNIYRTWDLSSLKFLMNAGEQVTPKVVQKFLKRVASFGVSSQVMQPAYGMAEVCTCMTYQNQFDDKIGIHRIQKSSLDGQLVKAEATETDVIEFTDLGLPLPGVIIRIVDSNNQLLQEGMIGQLQIKGQIVTPGYLNNQAANAEAFGIEGWFNTGDLGFIQEGRLVLTGRQKELIIINGVNYYCYEIEEIVNQIEGVEPTYVGAFGLNNPETGTEGLVIFFTPQDFQLESYINLIKTIRRQITLQIGIEPLYVIPLSRQEFPKTTSGKIQRMQLKKMVESGACQDLIKTIDIHLESANTIPDWFYRKTWCKQQAKTHPFLKEKGATLVFMDSLGLGKSVFQKLESDRHLCIQVETGNSFTEISPQHYVLNLAEKLHYQHLFTLLASQNIVIEKIIHLCNYEEYKGEISHLERLELAQQQGLYSILFLVQTLTEQQGTQSPVQLLFVASHSQALESTDPIAYEKTTALGLLKTITQEFSWIRCRSIDLPLAEPQLNASYLRQELSDQSQESEVAYRNQNRFVCRLEKVSFEQETKPDLPFKKGQIYLITGGLGGIGFEIAKYLLENYQATLLLVGRTPLPQNSTREIKRGLEDSILKKVRSYQQLQQLPGRVIYEAVDICDEEQLNSVVSKTISQLGGQLDGIIHLAGIFQEKLLKSETPESIAQVLRPKLIGTWVLHQLIKNNSNSFLINFSSINSFFGGTWVGAYAAANRFIEAFCAYQRNHCLLQSYCLTWSMWNETGMSQGYQMQEFSRAKGYLAMTSREGINSLLVALSHPQFQMLIGLDGNQPNVRSVISNVQPLQHLTAYFTSKTPALSVTPSHRLQLRDRFGTISYSHWHQLPEMPLTKTGEIDREQLLGLDGSRHNSLAEQTQPRNQRESQLVEIFQELLSVSKVSIHDNFFALGGNSLRATQFVSRLQQIFNFEVPVRTLFESPTVATLSESLESLHESSNIYLKQKLQELPNNSIDKRERIEL
ncbi:MAG: SDR family NAD(P)-dependent oxidoreductase [Limnoraphis sp.]